MTCSALKRAYRQRLRRRPAGPPLRLPQGIGGADRRRGSKARHHEYMPASLLKSQFDTLEEPLPGEPVITVDAGEAPEAEVEAIVAALGL